jgi:hypothetical protein
MDRKKKLIWWESEPVLTGAGQARARGFLDDPGRGGITGSPFYGPVTIPGESDPDGDAPG